MAVRFILTEYVNQLMARAVYDKLEDNTFAGRIPECRGVLAFATTLRECEDELRSTLEDWVLVGLKLGHPLPVPYLIMIEPQRSTCRFILVPNISRVIISLRQLTDSVIVARPFLPSSITLSSSATNQS